MRQGEVLGLSPDDVDWLRKVVRVRRQVRIVGSRPVFAPPKGGRERDVPLPESVALRLSAHLAAHPAREVTLPWLVPDGRPVTVPLMFTTTPGGAIRRGDWGRIAWHPATFTTGDREGLYRGLEHSAYSGRITPVALSGERVTATRDVAGPQPPGTRAR